MEETTEITPEAWLRFCALRDRWQHETMIVSDSTQIMSHPAAVEIMNGGHEMVFCIFEDMRLRRSYSDSYDRMVGLLSEMLPDVPLEIEIPFNLNQYADAWYEWGVANGYVKSAEFPNGSEALSQEAAQVPHERDSH